MAKLTYRTRGMSSPQGKPKVYFTCHPQDFNAFFDGISEEILHSQNCAVWYDEEPGAPYDEEELLSDLSGMQLVVIPVTSRFLYQDCRARTVEFPYALEHHIPVLPLMQESELESEFNRICGDLQFLDKNNRDATAISYEEKLEKFLSSVLVDDETAAKIRAAFDAYVFLSYRKKDRKYAGELMRLIHRNDFCRDIAIWYDEYLTPGENFNDAIRDAMEKSSLFTLLVTPNLVNEENYVMTVEYPAAQEAHKPVLPVEMEATDADALKKNYADIPECIRPQEQEKLARMLAEHLKDIAIRENDSDPQHLFFIGLAYLSGVDVEVDHERAVELIETAARAGLDEAMEKLVSMYRIGDGVARDYMTAIQWQEKLVECRKSRYGKLGQWKKEKWRRLFRKKEDNQEEPEGLDEGIKLLEAYLSLGDFWYELRKLNEAMDAYSDMFDLASEMCERFAEYPSLCLNLLISIEKIGIMCEEIKDYEKAEKTYKSGLELLESLADYLEEEEIFESLASFFNRLGTLCRLKGDFESSEEYLKLGMEAQAHLCALDGTAERNLELANAYLNMGDTCIGEERLADAEEWYAKSIEILEALNDEQETYTFMQNLAAAYARMGELYEAAEELESAEGYHRKALEISVRLSEEQQTPTACHGVGASYFSLASILLKEDHKEEAKSFYLKAMEIFDSLYEQTEDIMLVENLAQSYAGLGHVAIEEDDLTEAKEYYGKYLEIYEELSERTDDLEVWRKLYSAYMILGAVASDEGDFELAESYYTQCMSVSELLVKEHKTEKVRSELADIYELMGNLKLGTSELAEAGRYYKKAMRIREKLWVETRDVADYAEVAFLYYTIGAMDEDHLNMDYLQKAYEIWLDIEENLLPGDPVVAENIENVRSLLKEI